MMPITPAGKYDNLPLPHRIHARTWPRLVAAIRVLIAVLRAPRDRAAIRTTPAWRVRLTVATPPSSSRGS